MAASSSTCLESVTELSLQNGLGLVNPFWSNEKGRVVRGPFSTLQAWLIAVSPQPGVAVAIGRSQQRLEHSRL